jgi:hypothetical protein
VVATKSLLCYNANKVLQGAKTTVKYIAPPRLQGIVGWFDGAAVGDRKNNGAGGVIQIIKIPLSNGLLTNHLMTWILSASGDLVHK